MKFLLDSKHVHFADNFPTMKMTVRTPGTPASKIDRTPATTPGGPRAREEKIVVTVRLRPLNRKEQLAKDQVAWDCVDDYTIVYKPPAQERAVQPASFTFGMKLTCSPCFKFLTHYQFRIPIIFL